MKSSSNNRKKLTWNDVYGIDSEAVSTSNPAPRQNVPSDPYVTILEDWDERPDGVYYKWRLTGEKVWHEKLTAYKQKPVMSYKFLSQEEFKHWPHSGLISDPRPADAPDATLSQPTSGIEDSSEVVSPLGSRGNEQDPADGRNEPRGASSASELPTQPSSFKDKECWFWAKSLTDQGYAQMKIGGKRWGVHRYMYTQKYGEIPKGMVCDHLCRNRNCINPDHIEIVSNHTNLMRGVGIPAVNSQKTHCKRGHKFTASNIRQKPWGGRQCIKCEKLANREHYLNVVKPRLEAKNGF